MERITRFRNQKFLTYLHDFRLKTYLRKYHMCLGCSAARLTIGGIKWTNTYLLSSLNGLKCYAVPRIDICELHYGSCLSWKIRISNTVIDFERLPLKIVVFIQIKSIHYTLSYSCSTPHFCVHSSANDFKKRALQHINVSHFKIIIWQLTWQ